MAATATAASAQAIGRSRADAWPPPQPRQSVPQMLWPRQMRRSARSGPSGSSGPRQAARSRRPAISSNPLSQQPMLNQSSQLSSSQLSRAGCYTHSQTAVFLNRCFSTPPTSDLGRSVNCLPHLQMTQRLQLATVAMVAMVTMMAMPMVACALATPMDLDLLVCHC